MSSMGVIQQAGVLHAQLIREIAENTWWQAYGKILSGGQIRYMLNTLYSEDAIQQQIQNGSQTYLLMLEEDKVVGFASFAPREENPAIFKLHKLYCLPEVQNKGYGRLLIEEVERKVVAAGENILELNVNRNNKAIGFYEKLGFSVAYEENIPIGDFWMNDYVMRKIIVKGRGRRKRQEM